MKHHTNYCKWIHGVFVLNNKRGTAGELSRESLTIPSIVRQAQYDNLEAFADRVQNDEKFFKKVVRG